MGSGSVAGFEWGQGDEGVHGAECPPSLAWSQMLMLSCKHCMTVTIGVGKAA